MTKKYPADKGSDRQEMSGCVLRHFAYRFFYESTDKVKCGIGGKVYQNLHTHCIAQDRLFLMRIVAICATSASSLFRKYELHCVGLFFT